MNHLKNWFAAAILAACSHAGAQQTTVTNGSFESGFDDWTVAGNVSIQNAPPYSPTDGTKLAAFNAVNSTPNGSLSRTVIVPNSIIHTHRLRFDVGNLSYGSQDQKLNVKVIEILNGLPQVRVNDTITISGTSNGTNHWQAASYEFPTPITGSVQISFSDVSATTSSTDLLLDHVRIEDSRFVYVRSSNDYPNPGVNIGIAVQDAGPQPDGTTFFNRQFYLGETVTLTAPPSLGAGRPFYEWSKNGGHFGNNTSATFTITEDVTMKAVYQPLVSVNAGSFDVTGAVETGPFQPLFGSFTLTNESATPLPWSAVIDAPGIPAPWVAVWPPGGTLEAGGLQSLRLSVSANALGVPAGKFQGRVIISHSGGTTEIPISILSRNPDRLLDNGSFENGFAGWTTTGNVSLENAAPYAATDGTKLVAFNAVNSTPNGTLSQDFLTQPGIRYSLDFDAGALAFNPNPQHLRIKVSDAENAASPPLLDTTIQLFGGGGSPLHWTARHYEFVASATTTRITFSDLSATTASLDLVLDHIRVFDPTYHLTVTTALDENNPALGMGTGDSLRETLAEAVRLGGPHCIRFSPSLSPRTIILGGSSLPVNSEVAIDASDAAVTVSGNDASSVFQVAAPAAFHNLDVTHGSQSGIDNNGMLMLLGSRIHDNASTGSGGGILNQGTLVVDACSVTANHTMAAGGGIAAFGNAGVSHSLIDGNSAGTIGGGIASGSPFASAWFILTDSTVSHNTSGDIGGGYGPLTGYKVFGNLSAGNCTFAANTAVHKGGAITGSYNTDLRNCTISGNICTDPAGYAGGVAEDYLKLENSIVAGNSAAADPDISSSVIVVKGVNFTSGDPKLSQLGNFGGSTPTMPPLAGSPVIDATTSQPGTPASDQRGKPRLSGPALDMGAVEIQQRLVTTAVDETDGVNAGGISLRDALDAQATDPLEMIRFAPELAGQHLVLSHGELFIGTPLGIDASNVPGIVIDAANASRIFNISGDVPVTLHSLALTGGSAAGDGGAILSRDGVAKILTLSDLNIHHNAASGSGGGIANASGSIRVTRCRIGNNQAQQGGGGIDSQLFTFFNVTDSLVSENHAAINGGGMSMVLSKGDISGSTFAGNSAGASGGGVAAFNSGSPGKSGFLFVTNSTLTGNSATGAGAAIFYSSQLALAHCTVTGNTTPNSGALCTSAPFPNLAPLSLTNSVITGNTTPDGIDIVGFPPALSGNNLLTGDPRLAPLADYGGLTPTMPPLPGSPAIDAAILLAGIPATDQRGAARPYGPLPDIGAVEAFPFSSITLLDTDHDGIDDRLEPAWGLNVGTNDSSRDSDGDGSRDAEEIANMTDPIDSGSLLKILSFTHAAGPGDSYDITFTSFPGLSYVVECDQNLHFTSPSARALPTGTALGPTTTIAVPMLPDHDFARVRRDP